MGEGSPQSAIRRYRAPLAVLGLLLLAGILGVSFSSLAHGQHGSSAQPGEQSTPPTPTPSPTRLLSVPGPRIADATAPLKVTLSGPPAQGSPPPLLRPAVAGSWAKAGDTETFTPVSTLEPCSKYTLTIWAGTTATGQSALGRRRTLALSVRCPPISGLQQALARLGYLGASFHSLYGIRIPGGPESRATAARHAYHPGHGRLAPDPSDAPAVRMGVMDATTTGALEVFQADRGLAVTGEPDRATWAPLLAVETLDRRDRHGYTWVSVSEALPETLAVHEGDRVTLTTPVNTGVPGAETETGIFPIYARYVSTTMTGTDPDGTHYLAPDVPWVNYFNGGDAVHGYPRASYGFPQSNGCVELPIAAAQRAFGMLQIGDIVEVDG
jgi:peptidoglycan hydrolase-like protein with peptidoglycan-binding domain